MQSEAEFYEGRDLEVVADLDNYYDWILTDLLPHMRGRTLEVGAGVGTVASRYVDAVDHATLLEPARNLQPKLAQRFAGHDNVQVICAMVEEAYGDGRLAGASFDSVIMVNVLEHIRDDVASLRTLFELLRPGGRLLIFVPAQQWLYGSIDELLGHVRRYSRAQLDAVVSGAGFFVEQMRFMDVLGVLAWFFAGRVLRQRYVSPAGAAAYDRFGVPVTRFIERRIDPPIGKNLLCIARKPSTD